MKGNLVNYIIMQMDWFNIVVLIFKKIKMTHKGEIFNTGPIVESLGIKSLDYEILLDNMFFVIEMIKAHFMWIHKVPNLAREYLDFCIGSWIVIPEGSWIVIPEKGKCGAHEARDQ